jgi:hypothetical protein
MKKLLLSTILIFAFSASGLACTMPEIQGIKPGMNKAQAEKQLNQKLSRSQSIQFSNIPEVKTAYVDKIKGIETLSLHFYGEGIYLVLATYDDSIKWKSLAEFAEASAKNLQMPDIQWQFLDKKFKTTSKESAKYAAYYCSNFKIFVSYISNKYSLSVMDTEVFARIDMISRIKATQPKPPLQLPKINLQR